MLLDVLARLQHKRRFCIALFQDDLISQRGELFGEKCEQSHGGIVFVWWNERSFLPRFANVARESHSMTLQFAAHFCTVRFRWRMTQHLADAQISDDFRP